MLFNSYSYEILYEQFHWIYLQGDIKLLLVTVNNRLKFEIEIIHDLSCHPILTKSQHSTVRQTAIYVTSKCKKQLYVELWKQQPHYVPKK